jgi:hypothetical protein
VDLPEWMAMGRGRVSGRPLRSLARPALPFDLLASLLGGLAGELIPAPLHLLLRVPGRPHALRPRV